MEISIDNFFKITKIQFSDIKINNYECCIITLDKNLDLFFDDLCACVWIEWDNSFFPRYTLFKNNIIYISDILEEISNWKEGTTILITKGVFNIYDKEKIWNLLANENNLTLDQINILTKLI